MSAENRSNPPIPAADREDFDLAARIAELHEQGILAGGGGPRGSLQRLVDDLRRKRLESDQE